MAIAIGSIILTGAPLEPTPQNQKAVNNILRHILNGYHIEDILVQGYRSTKDYGSPEIPGYGIPTMIWTELKNTYPERTAKLVLPGDLQTGTYMKIQRPLKHYNLETPTIKTNTNFVKLAEQAALRYAKLTNGLPSVRWVLNP